MKTLRCGWILLLAGLTSAVVNGENHITMLKNLLEKNKYQAVRPNYGGDAVNVSVGVYVNSFLVDDMKMEYEMSFYIRETWIDPRMSFESDDFDQIDVQDKATIDQFWTPDVFFRSDVSTRVATEEMGHNLMRISKDGRMWFVRKLHSRQKCPMNLRKFPFDQQWCPIRFESFGYTTNDLKLSFMDNELDIDRDVKSTLERYSFNGKRISDCSQNYTAGMFPCLMMSFCMKRDVGYFILQLYLPSLLLVALSWLSFWISVRFPAPRMTLLLSMVLALLLLCYVTKADLPKVSYATGLDAWNIACVLLVLLALVEFLLVYALGEFCGKCSKAEDASGSQESPAPAAAADKSSPLDKVSRPFKPAGAACGEVIDRCCRLVFPLVFLIFNIIYWGVMACRDD